MYDRVRPGYPSEAVSWLIPRDARVVVDIGAGTGALTRSLVTLGLEVIAVEPDEKMREVLASRSPSADVREGRAEEIPLEDAEADAVVGGQMWHWVDLEPATAEVARVLKPGGTLGLVWNQRNDSVPWMAELSAIFGSEQVESSPTEVMIAPGAPFRDVASAEFSFVQCLASVDLVNFVASRSHIQVMDPARRAELLERVELFSRTHPDLEGKESIEVPYVTECWRATRA